MGFFLRRAALALIPALLLSACASTYLLETNVQTFYGVPGVPPGPSYRFERLPSQQASPFQAQLEAMADPALFKAGLRRDDAAPRYSVQVSARVQRILSPWTSPWDVYGGGFGYMGPRAGFATAFGRLEQPWFQREVGIVVRELPAGKVVYETHAASDGPWSDNTSVLPAMYEAALQGFPNPPQGVRRVNIQVGTQVGG